MTEIKKKKTPKPKIVPEEQVAAEITPVKAVTKVEREISMLLLFKVVGKSNWRKAFFANKEALDTYLAMPGQKNHAEITDKKWFEINHITGTIAEVK